MTLQDRQIQLQDLCARVPYHPKGHVVNSCNGAECDEWLTFETFTMFTNIMNNTRLYLRPLPSMTEEEARDIAILHGNKSEDILSVKVTDEYIDIILDDGVCGTITSTIWYDEIISSVECLDYLNKKMFDYRGLIQKCLAISTEVFNPYKD